MQVHKRDSENMTHHHSRRFPQSSMDHILMRLKDYALLVIALGGIGGIIATTTRWIQKPSEVAENAVILSGRLNKIEERVNNNEKTLQQIAGQGQKNGENIQEVIRRTDRIENLLDKLILRKAGAETKYRDTNG